MPKEECNLIYFDPKFFIANPLDARMFGTWVKVFFTQDLNGNMRISLPNGKLYGMCMKKGNERILSLNYPGKEIHFVDSSCGISEFKMTVRNFHTKAGLTFQESLQSFSLFDRFCQSSLLVKLENETHKTEYVLFAKYKR